MGACQSKPVIEDSSNNGPPTQPSSGSSSSTKRKPSTAPPTRPTTTTTTTRRNTKKKATSTVATRQRLDSWANNTHQQPQQHHQHQHHAPHPHSYSPTPRYTVESQWRWLWETHAPVLADPVDTPAVLDELMQRTLNLLSPIQFSFLQRKIRSTVTQLARPNNSKKLVMWSNQAVVNASEARFAAERHHVLMPAIWQQRVLPNLTSVLETASDEQLVMTNIQHLLLHLSVPWDDNKTTETDVEWLDVNKCHHEERPMPKPSSVPDWTEPVELPVGVTLQALAVLPALAAAGCRAQRLQLLFYVMLEDLPQFLALHPVRGIPVWLLEVGTGLVTSLASLTHYHYYGTAFLPIESKHHKKPPFVASQSRQPVQVSGSTVLRVVRALLTRPNNGEDANHKDAEALDHNGGVNGFSPSASGHGRQSSLGGNNNGQTHHVSVMERILQASSASELFTAAVQASLHKMEMAPIPSDDEWTLQDFRTWAEQALDETGLEIVMHRLFCAGILPTAPLEKDLVVNQWEAWQRARQDWHRPEHVVVWPNKALTDYYDNENGAAVLEPMWGGMGGLDGGGGIGYGFMFCVDKQWWDSWVAYVGWSWLGERPARRQTFARPGNLMNDRLIDRESVIPGIMGSYELMRHGLVKNKDYVLVPPGVWNVLFELYGGGPPLPRMVRPPERKFSDMNRMSGSERSDSIWEGDNNGDAADLDAFMEELGSSTTGAGRVLRLPDSISVTTHPWIIHVQLCEPTQPYRRGDAGVMSIRVMVTPYEPLWRMLAEIIARFPLAAFKAFDADRRQGKARLWKRVEPSGLRVPTSRYGPWNLLCKGRHATLPMVNGHIPEDLPELVEDWKDYSDNATVESIGLTDQDHLMFEFAVQNKQGDLIWPREAAAKAGRVRRLVEEENEFRRILQGVDEEGKALLNPPRLVGMNVDAMDASGRWYPVKILEVDIIDDDTEEEVESDSPSDDRNTACTSSKKVRVDFSEYGGHVDWIDIESDRLGPAGRFTNEAEQQQTQKGPASPKPNGSSGSPNDKGKGPVVVKKASSTENGTESAKLCPLPGYGACGLTNLGNTCYMNSALQCISYLPLLRSYLLSSQYKKAGDLNKDNPLGTGGKLLEESAELLRIMWSARLGEKSPTRFKSVLGKINGDFSGADQQDAQEFLNYILDILHEDSNKVQNKPYVEALEDDWVKKTSLARVGEEAWRRFLRRNRSIMADVAMGQVLNTVTCPVCNYSSRNFDPFNLLSIPIPKVTDVVFQCTVVRRATALNCPWLLNRPPRGSKRIYRFSTKRNINANGSPPSDTHVAEQYVVTMSRLADSGDLRFQIERLCGIPAANLRLCRAEQVRNEKFNNGTVLSSQTKLVPLNDKEGPCSQLARKRSPNEDSPASPTVIIAFESTLNPRQEREERSEDDTVVDDDESESADERVDTLSHLNRYGDEEECRLVDSDPFLIAKAMSRIMWPETEGDLRVGLRVDAKDHRGNWFAGSVTGVFDEVKDGSDADTGEEVRIRTKKVCVHFDNFSTKWDETYAINHFAEGKVRPLYSHASPKARPTEFLVFNRFTDSVSVQTVYFGQPFYVQCESEWSNARAAAQIVSQTARFMHHQSEAKSTDESSVGEREARVQRIYEKTCQVMSDLIDLLVEHDREYVRGALGVSEQDGDDIGQVVRNRGFDAAPLSASLARKVAELLPRLPFEIRMCSTDPSHADKGHAKMDEETFPFSLTRTIGNYMNARNVIILQWRSPPKDKRPGAPSSYSRWPVMYVEPELQIDKESAELLQKTVAATKENGKKSRPGSAGMDLGVCLTEFCKAQKLSQSDGNWRCPRCKDFREGKQEMNLWRLPDLLTFHIKRFNMSARWREKITTKVNFPLTGLDPSELCHKESPVIREDPADSHIYDLIGVMNHYGSMTGGHYVAMCKATGCGREGKEEVAYGFNGFGVGVVESEESDTPSGWRPLRPKAEVNQSKMAAALSARAVSKSAEPTWLQFDDELVEPIPPDHVVSEAAYVLFYRRRRIASSNIAKYSTLE